jgi:hypothetical protein
MTTMSTTPVYSENQLLKLEIPVLVDLAGVGKRSMATGKPWTKKPLIAIIMRDQGNATARVLANLPTDPEPVEAPTPPPALTLVGKVAATPAPAINEVDPGPAEVGYTVRWPHKAYDLLQRDAGTEGPKWVVRCNVHGTTTSADSVGAADTMGRKAGRAGWCPGCRS